MFSCLKTGFFAAAILLVPVLVFGAPPEPLSDEELLDTIQRQSLDFFLIEANPSNGLIQDRASNFSRGQTRSAASIASVGFGLTAYGVGVERNWMDEGTAREKTIRTLRFFLEQAPHEHGFFYHFMDMNTGKNTRQSELSPIDTTLFLAGALFAAEYFEDIEIRDLAMKLYERVDWPWMLHGGETFSKAWSPSGGFMRQRWDHYDEAMLMYLLAIASPTHPIPASSWKAVRRPVGSYGQYKLIHQPPLFTHQYSHIWVDFRNQNDGIADYFKNSVNATLANRQFCIDQGAKYKTYGPHSWGITASDGPGGYRAYGAPPGWAEHDGTLAPTACGSSIVFTPKESISCLRHFYETHYDKLWGQYGFSDAFNLDKNWFGTDVIGIDQGALLLMIENYRSELIWKTMSKNVYIQEAMKSVGFKPGTKEVEWKEPPQVKAAYSFKDIQIDGYLRDWTNNEAVRLGSSHATIGIIKDDEDLNAEIRFSWDANYLYFYVKATDNHVISRKAPRNIWQEDVVEIFIDAEGDGLYWKDLKDFQIGFGPRPDNTVAVWSWFQDEDPTVKQEVKAAGYVYSTGYLIEAAISWNYLGFRPKAGMTVRLSPAIHDLDKDRTEGKAEWFMRSAEKWKRFDLGKIVLEDSTTKAVKTEKGNDHGKAESTV